MDTNEIQRRLDVMNSVILGKGKVQPEARFSMVSDTEISVSVSWVKRNAVQKYERDYRAFRGGDVGLLLAGAESYVAELPDAETERMAEFTERLASVIEMGRDIGVDAQFVNPLIETMKRLSENVITDQRS
jgi:hypothetical protein